MMGPSISFLPHSPLGYYADIIIDVKIICKSKIPPKEFFGGISYDSFV